MMNCKRKNVRKWTIARTLTDRRKQQNDKYSSRQNSNYLLGLLFATCTFAACLLRFADINIAVHVFHHHFAAAAVDFALYPVVNAYFVHAIFGYFGRFRL